MYLDKDKFSEIIIKHYHVFFLILGIILVLISLIDIEEYSSDSDANKIILIGQTATLNDSVSNGKNRFVLMKQQINEEQKRSVSNWDKFVSFLIKGSGEIGSFFLSTALIVFGYEKWKNSQEKYFLMSEDHEYREELKKIDLYEYIPKKKILPIMQQEEFLKTKYRLPYLLKKYQQELKGKTVFIYGSSMNFLSRPDYQEAFINATKNGINFKLAIYNFKNVGNSIEQKVAHKAQMSFNYIGDIISQTTEHNNVKGFIEVRFVNNIPSHSFSSLDISDKRSIRTLDFNFEISDEENGLKKYSQIFDFTRGKTDLKKNLSDYLYSHYLSSFSRSILASYSKYPITIYMCGISYNNENKKIIVLNKYNKLPKCKKEKREPDSQELDLQEWAIKEYEKEIKATLVIKEYVKRTNKGNENKDTTGIYLLIGSIKTRDKGYTNHNCKLEDIKRYNNSYLEKINGKEFWNYFDKYDFEEIFNSI